ncbi:hypothetical protein B296_00008641 [Ensete ventricosum]|uniref:Uncharacterized protein n=1 Tax=Ensete ventricosum TaxID=4639 RepID=A0A427AY98_ENSVE|nr:hypothetical protein B296_00008641 [Ensete ventricosum]
MGSATPLVLRLPQPGERRSLLLHSDLHHRISRFSIDSRRRCLTMGSVGEIKSQHTTTLNIFINLTPIDRILGGLPAVPPSLRDTAFNVPFLQ